MATNTHDTIPVGYGPIDYQLTSGVKVMECKYKCGNMFVVSKRTKNAPHHMACGIMAAMQCIQQLHDHQGPYWDRWLRAMATWVERNSQYDVIGTDA